MKAKSFTLNSIRARFLLLSTLLIIAIMGGLGVFIANQNSTEIKKALDLKAASVTNLSSLSRCRVSLNYNFVALDRLVEDYCEIRMSVLPASTMSKRNW